MRKLTDSDKQEILKLYRETAETTSTLAERYGVSNSTISRLLKSTLPEEEYEYLVSLKRAARTPEGRAQVNYDQLPLLSQPQPQPEPPSFDQQRLEVVEVEQPQKPEKEKVSHPVAESETFAKPLPSIRRVKTRSSAIEKTPEPTEDELEIVRHQPQEILRHQPQEILRHQPQSQDISRPRPQEIPTISSPISNPILEDDRTDTNLIAEIFGEDLLDEDELEDDEDFEDEDFEDDDFEETKPFVTRRRFGEAPVQVLPLSVAHLPKTCYLVIDRSAELITRPLKDFGDLGQIPTLETQQRTLPVFDNHRVAKRFSTKRDRVIKIPDSRVLHKARTHLQAKGITRLLIDGQVYSLSLV
ncbi:MAG TPA: transposase [Nostocaceae cyanobacterium]|nr:transposase [Nostocaceae cyanobacterium]